MIIDKRIHWDKIENVTITMTKTEAKSLKQLLNNHWLDNIGLDTLKIKLEDELEKGSDWEIVSYNTFTDDTETDGKKE